MSTDLFAACQIGSLELKNRWVRSATWDATADSHGAVTDDSVALYRELGQGGIGLIVSGYAFVSPLGQAVFGQYGVHTDDMIPGWRRLVRAAQEGGAKIALQIVHAGINSDYLRRQGLTVLALSRMPGMNRPHQEMTDEDIEAIIADFAAAAVRGREAGFDAIQLHGAHGYLMSQFLSPLFNHRTDRWGDTAENRRRSHLKVTQKVRQALGADFPLLIKLGIQDDREGGLTFEEGLETAQQMVAEGIHAIEIITGIGAPVPVMKEDEPERAYFRERAASAKRGLSVPVILVGGIRSLEMAQDIVDSGDADLIAMSRPLIRDPGLIARWQRGETEPARCISCNKCLAIVGAGNPLRCSQEHP